MDQEETLIRWNSSLTEWLIPNNIFLSLYLIVGVFGNALVLFIYIFRMRNGKDDRYFIPSLAAVDICACTIGASYALALNLLPVRFPGDFLCKVLWFLSQSSTISSSLLLLVIAVHRYMKVCKPLKPKWSLKYKRLAVGLSITSAVVVSLPTFAFYGEIQIYNAELNVTGYRCSHVHERTVGYDFLILYNIILFVCACGGIVVISTLYVLVGKSIYAKVIQFRKSMRRPKKIPTPVYSVSADNNHNAFNDVRGQTTTLSEEGKTSMSSELPNGSAQNDAVMEDEASAFRPGFGCQSTLLRVVEDWKQALDQHKFVGAVLMDLSKAFDCLPHKLLLEKLKYYGVTEHSLKLITSYLSDRLQCVKLNGFISSYKNTIKGVPQGSIFGPVLFNIFINDIFLFVQNATLYNYADDNTLSHSDSDPQKVVSALVNDSSTLIDWFSFNRMKANPSKFQAIAVGKKSKKKSKKSKLNLLTSNVRMKLNYLGYYQLDSVVVRELLGKKLSSRNRKDLDDVHEKTKIPIRSCRRQYDNMRRVFKTVEELMGSLVDNIQSHYLLSEDLAKQYAAIVFIANNRFETGKKKLNHLTFHDFAFCANLMIANWSYSAVECKVHEDMDVDLDRGFLHELRELKLLLEKDTVDEYKSRVLHDTKSKLSKSTYKDLDEDFKNYSKAMINIAYGLNHRNEARDIFIDMVEKITDPCMQKGWTKDELQTFLYGYRDILRHLDVFKHNELNFFSASEGTKTVLSGPSAAAAEEIASCDGTFKAVENTDHPL
ncbi:hypothetical protein FSP39_022688 [Pinctada imbricata]|uniref:G-protein coupled receptors family 1 profile domain-containing protein n=1 Tax=Pinctada imbricata TaxID=66713 RepID=A0AA88Y199_PINIB|nr:hypothetical protein FSP39_022688 [Pinctada imbricata]